MQQSSQRYESIAHGPGPPQRPHIPCGVERDAEFDEPLATAKTLSSRDVRFDPHFGQATTLDSPAGLTSFSN